MQQAAPEQRAQGRSPKTQARKKGRPMQKETRQGPEQESDQLPETRVARGKAVLAEGAEADLGRRAVTEMEIPSSCKAI